MFAIYDHSKFPEVKVTFHGNITTEKDFTDFTKQWYDLYEKKENFSLSFDMADISMINPVYCYKMAFFIQDLKQQVLTSNKDLKILHIIVENYIIDGNKTPEIPLQINCENLIIEANLI